MWTGYVDSAGDGLLTVLSVVQLSGCVVCGLCWRWIVNSALCCSAVWVCGMWTGCVDGSGEGRLPQAHDRGHIRGKKSYVCCLQFFQLLLQKVVLPKFFNFPVTY